MLYENEILIANDNWNKVKTLSEILVKDGYAVMITMEEDYIVVNFEYAGEGYDTTADRNKMVFISRDRYEYEREKELNDLTNGC